MMQDYDETGRSGMWVDEGARPGQRETLEGNQRHQAEEERMSSNNRCAAADKGNGIVKGTLKAALQNTETSG
jgi:hypothetical protein